MGNKSSNFPEWLYENLYSKNSLYGYWTSTPNDSYSDNVWIVSYKGDFQHGSVSSRLGFSVRPVITLSKSNIS